MNEPPPQIVAATEKVALTQGAFLGYLKSRGLLRNDLIDAVLEECLVRAAQDASLRVSAEELQSAADRFRYRHGLPTAQQMHGWLAEQGLSANDWEQSLKRQLLIDKYADHLLAIHGEQHFAQHPDLFARAKLRRIVVTHEGLAREILMQITEDGRTFTELTVHSIDVQGRATGGVVGVLLRCQLPVATAQLVFAAQEGDTVGPVLEQDGYALYEIEQVMPPTYDDATIAAVKHSLMEAFVCQHRSEVTIHWSAFISATNSLDAGDRNDGHHAQDTNQRASNRASTKRPRRKSQ